MKVCELIKLLQKLENQDWEIVYLDGEYGDMKIEEIRIDTAEEKTYIIW